MNNKVSTEELPSAAVVVVDNKTDRKTPERTVKTGDVVVVGRGSQQPNQEVARTSGEGSVVVVVGRGAQSQNRPVSVTNI